MCTKSSLVYDVVLFHIMIEWPKWKECIYNGILDCFSLDLLRVLFLCSWLLYSYELLLLIVTRQICAGLAIYVTNFVKAYVKESRKRERIQKYSSHVHKLLTNFWWILYVISYILTYLNTVWAILTHISSVQRWTSIGIFFYILYVFYVLSNFSQDLKFWFSEFMPDRNC